MQTVLTLGFYLVSMITAMYFTGKAVKEKEKKWLWVPVILLSLIAGCRAYSVGTDTERVVESILYTYRKGTFSHSKEYLYYFLCEVLMKIFRNPSVVLLAIAVITNGLVFFRLWDFRKVANIMVSVAVYFMFYFGMSMNIARQALAVAVVFYFTRYIQSREYVKYFGGVVIAFFIHVSSCVALVIPIVYLASSGMLKKEMFLENGKISKKTWKLIFGVLGVGLAALAYLVHRYSEYLSAIKIDIGAMQTVWLLLIIGTYFSVMYQNKTNKKYFIGDTSDKVLKTIFYISFIGCFIAFLEYIVPWAGRVGYVFKIFEVVFYGMICKRKRYNEMLKYGVLCILLVLGVYTLYRYSGIVPYAFIWQEG